MITGSIAENRELVLRHLRTNPGNFYQCHLHLDDGLGGRCAIGLICNALEIDTDQSHYSEEELEANLGPYGEVERSIGCDSDVIWILNDLRGMTFCEIADFLESYWDLSGEY